MKYKALVICVSIVALSTASLQAQDTKPSFPQVKHLIDTHIHLYDTSRDGGVPWPPADDEVLYKPHLPAEYSREAKAAGVTGVVIVEASDRLADNHWVLEQVAGDPFYLALVGNIDPNRSDFGEQLTLLRKDKRFVGIRARVKEPIDYTNARILTNFRLLEQAGLSLDILANSKGIAGVQEVEELAGKLPKLRIVVDHVLGYDIDGQPPSAEWIEAVARLAKHPNVYCKVSGLYQRCVLQPASQDLAHYTSVLDPLWEHFGRDRLVYGSNWPCTKKSGDYASFVSLVNAYFSQKGQEAAERLFWKNAVVAYGLKIE